MQKYYTNLDDNSRSRLLDMAEWLVPRAITAGCILIILGLCAHLEAL